MPTPAEQLASIKTTAFARIVAIQAEIADGDVRKPTYSVEGRAVSWNEFRRSLMDEMRAMQEQINWVNDQLANEAGPIEFISVGYAQ